MSRVIETLLRLEEGERLYPYQDTKGLWTIGVGHLIDRRRGGSLPVWIRPSFPLEQAEVDQLLKYDIRAKERDLDSAVPWWRGMDEVRGAVLLSMTFQMGLKQTMRFKRAIQRMRVNNWPAAAEEMLDSKWAREDSPSRAERHAVAMRTGINQWGEM